MKGYVGRWIGTIKPPCFSLAGLVLLSADQLSSAASGFPTNAVISSTIALTTVYIVVFGSVLCVVLRMTSPAIKVIDVIQPAFWVGS